MRDVGRLLSTIIDEAQGLAGQQKNRGGAPADEEKAMLVSRLKLENPNMKARDVAEQAGIDYAGPEDARRKVRYRRAQGDAIHKARYGDNWRQVVLGRAKDGPPRNKNPSTGL